MGGIGLHSDVLQKLPTRTTKLQAEPVLAVEARRGFIIVRKCNFQRTNVPGF